MSKKHPGWEAILAYVESGSELHATAEHVEGCARCREIARRQRSLLDSLESSRLEEPPATLVEAALRRITAARAAADSPLQAALAELFARLPKPLREIRAVLIADSLIPSPLLRGSGTARRSLLFDSEDYRIALGLGSAADRPGILKGQVSPKHSSSLPEGGRAILGLRDGVKECMLSRFGEFEFPGGSPEGIELAVVFRDQWIRLSL